MKTSAEAKAFDQERAFARGTLRAGGHSPRMYCPACRLGFNDEERYKDHYRTFHTPKGRR